MITESTSSNPDIPDNILGDLLGDGRTVEDADLVVTPSRVESAIHNMDSDAQEDVRNALNINFLNLPDVTPTDYTGQGGMAVVVNSTGTALEFGEASGGADTIETDTETYTYTSGTTTEGEDTLILTRNTGNILVGTHIFRADGTVDYMVTGQVISGGGVT